MRTAFLLIVMVCALMTVCPFALATQNNYGCGLGSMMIDNNDSLVSQTVAASMNGCFGSQIFGMSSGTSNCDKPDSLVHNAKVNTFVADNMDNLAGDIARGQGEYLDTLATLMEIPEDGRTPVYAALQNNFSTIYPSDDVTHVDVIRNIEAVM